MRNDRGGTDLEPSSHLFSQVRHPSGEQHIHPHLFNCRSFRPRNSHDRYVVRQGSAREIEHLVEQDLGDLPSRDRSRITDESREALFPQHRVVAPRLGHAVGEENEQVARGHLGMTVDILDAGPGPGHGGPDFEQLDLTAAMSQYRIRVTGPAVSEMSA